MNQATAKFPKALPHYFTSGRSHSTMKEETFYVCHSRCANLLLLSYPSESTVLWKLGTILALTVFITLPLSFCKSIEVRSISADGQWGL